MKGLLSRAVQGRSGPAQLGRTVGVFMLVVPSRILKRLWSLVTHSKHEVTLLGRLALKRTIFIEEVGCGTKTGMRLRRPAGQRPLAIVLTTTTRHRLT